MAATISTFDAALASLYSSERLEGMLYAWTSPQRPRPQPATAHECDNCGAPWHDEHQADSGPCFYCHARRPWEVHVGDAVGGRTVSVDRGAVTFDRAEAVADLRSAGLLSASTAREMLNAPPLAERMRSLMAQQAALDTGVAALVGRRSGMSHRGATGLLRRVLGLG